jgi:predicted nucleic acid-binding protein
VASEITNKRKNRRVTEEGYWQMLQPLWLKFQAGEIEIITSELTLMEVLVYPFRNNDAALTEDYENLLLSSEIQLTPITQPILREAARLRGSTNLKTPDAIHVATSISTDCDLFLTNDIRIRNIPDCVVVNLTEVLNS